MIKKITKLRVKIKIKKNNNIKKLNNFKMFLLNIKINI